MFGKVLFTTVSCLVGAATCYWLYAEEVSEVETDVSTDMALISAGAEYANAAKVGAISHISTPFRAHWVHMTRAKFGLLTDSSANRLVLGDWLRKSLLEAGVRPTHVSLHVPILVELCLIPTDSDIYASEIRRTSERARRLLAAGRPQSA